MTRKQIQTTYLRVCKDSGFSMCPFSAAFIAGNVLGVAPLEVAFAFGIDTMKLVARGKHPFCQTKC